MAISFANTLSIFFSPKHKRKKSMSRKQFVGHFVALITQISLFILFVMPSNCFHSYPSMCVAYVCNRAIHICIH